MKIHIGKQYLCRGNNNIAYVHIYAYNKERNLFIGRAYFGRGGAHITAHWQPNGVFLSGTGTTSWDLVEERHANVISITAAPKKKRPYLGSFQHTLDEFRKKSSRLEKERTKSNKKIIANLRKKS